MIKDYNATLVINLDGEEIRNLFNKFPRDVKRNLKKAEQNNLQFLETDNSNDAWEIFYDIYKEVWTDRGIKPNSLIYLKKYKLFLLQFNEMCIVGATIEVKDDFINFIAVVAKNEFNYVKPNEKLYWELIKWAKNKNLKWVNLGGYQLQAKGNLNGVNKFKEKFGQYKIIDSQLWQLPAMPGNLLF